MLQVVLVRHSIREGLVGKKLLQSFIIIWIFFYVFLISVLLDIEFCNGSTSGIIINESNKVLKT